MVGEANGNTINIGAGMAPLGRATLMGVRRAQSFVSLGDDSIISIELRCNSQ